jgi:uncharacterized membrane protein
MSRDHIHEPATFGDRAADGLGQRLGTWRYLGCQSAIIVAWAVANIAGLVHLDPWPLIFLNLCLSLQAAYTGPVLQMSANRHAAKDRLRDDHEAEEVSLLLKINYEQLDALGQHAAMAEQLRQIDLKLTALHRRLRERGKP